MRHFIIPKSRPALPILSEYLAPPTSVPSANAVWLQQRGRDWQQIVFAEETTGAAVRFTQTKEQPAGHFATNLWFLQSKEARQQLELSVNSAAYKHRVKIAAGTTAMIGRMTSSDAVQYYFPDAEGLTFYEATATDSGSSEG